MDVIWLVLYEIFSPVSFAETSLEEKVELVQLQSSTSLRLANNLCLRHSNNAFQITFLNEISTLSREVKTLYNLHFSLKCKIVNCL